MNRRLSIALTLPAVAILAASVSARAGVNTCASLPRQRSTSR